MNNFDWSKEFAAAFVLVFDILFGAQGIEITHANKTQAASHEKYDSKLISNLISENTLLGSTLVFYEWYNIN